jgi:hypothetical protein
MLGKGYITKCLPELRLNEATAKINRQREMKAKPKFTKGSSLTHYDC